MSNITKRPWTADEIAFLEQSYQVGTPTLAIAGALSRTDRSVRGKAHCLKLKHHGKVSHLYTPYDDHYIRTHAQELTRNEIAKSLGRTEGSVSQRGRRLGVVFKNTKKNAKYKKNHDFFHQPNLENSYWAGLLAADGWIRPESSGKSINQVGISLKAEDIHVLESFREATNYTGVIREYSADGFPQAELRISGVPQWINDLQLHWNLTPRKTLTLQPPNENLLTQGQLMAFHVGLIEGDGHICIKGGSLKVEMVTASEDFADWLELSWANIARAKPSRYLHQNGTAHYVSLFGANARRLCSKLMATKTHRLMRKWNIARSEIAKCS